MGLLFALNLPLPCGQITVVLLNKGCGGVIGPFEGLNVGITVLFEDTGQPVHTLVDFLLYACNLFLQGLMLFTLEQSGRLGKLLFQLGKLSVHKLLDRPGFVPHFAY